MRATEIRATRESVGEWNGLEQTAADQANKIYDGITEKISRRGDDPYSDEFGEIYSRVWNDWGSEESLLTLTDTEIADYVERIV